MKNLQNYLSTCLLGIAALLVGASPAWAQTAPSAPSLGLAADFAALGGAGVTCTSPNPPLPFITISGGNVGSGLPAISSVTGFPGFTPGALPCSLSGEVLVHQTAAIGNLTTAYNTLAENTCPRTELGHNLSGDLRSGPQGNVLEPGVYCISGVGLLTGQLTLDGRGNSNAVWIFIAASSLTPIGGSVVMINGGKACNVYWRTGTAVTLDNTDFVGNVLAGSAISFTGVGSSLVGRALAITESVTMTGANISGCAAIPPGTVPPGTVPNFPPACSDRVTGHGSIITNIATGDKSKFGVTGGINKKGKLRGHLTYIDDKGTKVKSDDVRVKGTGVTKYVVVNATTRRIEGTAKINGVAGTYTVVVTDGPPGTSDTFAITLSTGYTASGTLTGGNIKIKRHCDKKDGDGDDDDDDDDDGKGNGKGNGKDDDDDDDD